MLLCSCNETDSKSREIIPVSREDGSGTRSAFADLLEIVDENGTDIITDNAEVTNSTAVMITTISGTKGAIGYISLGSMQDSVKAVAIDGVMPSADNIKSGKYKLSRKFLICFKEDKLSPVARDFEKFILSKEAEKIIEDGGYISKDSRETYIPLNLKGKITIAGSTSVAPVLDALADEYKRLNGDADIEIQQSGSSAGISSAIKGVCDMAMSSRTLSESERKFLAQKEIATDGIVVIVNNQNPVEEMSSKDIRAVFSGEITDWDKVGQVKK